jgi:hypothetical protein
MLLALSGVRSVPSDRDCCRYNLIGAGGFKQQIGDRINPAGWKRGAKMIEAEANCPSDGVVDSAITRLSIADGVIGSVVECKTGHSEDCESK